MAKKKSKKVIRYRRPLNINVGMIIFFIIFIYLVFSVYTYLKREKIQFYEVVDGGIVNNRIYNGLILREEQVRTADRSGYINYYLREGKRASVGSRIYSLDETGNLEALLKENAEEGTSLSDDSLSDLKKQLTSFVLSFQNQDFGTIYDARISLDASVMEYSSFSTLDQLDKLAEQSGAVFEQVRSDVSGVVSYGIDSFESMTTSDVEAASFDLGRLAGGRVDMARRRHLGQDGGLPPTPGHVPQPIGVYPHCHARQHRQGAGPPARVSGWRFPALSQAFRQDAPHRQACSAHAPPDDGSSSRFPRPRPFHGERDDSCCRPRPGTRRSRHRPFPG